MIDDIVGFDQSNFKFIMGHQSILIPVTKIKLVGDRSRIWVNISNGINAMLTRKQLYSESCHFLALAGIPYKYDQCHTTLRGLGSVCAKLEPPSSKNKGILEINVLQNFTPHALCPTGCLRPRCPGKV